jgi:hypothetical protein
MGYNLVPEPPARTMPFISKMIYVSTKIQILFRIGDYFRYFM